MSEHPIAATQNEVGLAANGVSLMEEEGEERLEIKLSIWSVNTAWEASKEESDQYKGVAGKIIKADEVKQRAWAQKGKGKDCEQSSEEHQ